MKKLQIVKRYKKAKIFFYFLSFCVLRLYICLGLFSGRDIVFL